MKIDILCGAGSTDGVVPSDIYGKNGRVGVGGSELALLTLCEGWFNQGHDIRLYNNPRRASETFEQLPVEHFYKDEARDILIVFREPTAKAYKAKGKIIFFSCDQYTTGDFAHFSTIADAVVTISPFHSEYFKQRYNIDKSIHIDLPVRDWEYNSPQEKVPNRLIFTSVPDRGLEHVARMYPILQSKIPDISLVITSDYRLWGNGSPGNSGYVARFINSKNVQFLGAVPRERLIQEQQKAQIHFYPGTYDELFAIAVAESQVAGVLPITSDAGAMKTTNMGVVIEGHPIRTQGIFIEKTISYLQNPELPNIQANLSKLARERFSLNTILAEWDKRVLNG